METKWNSVWKRVFSEEMETQSCLCMVLVSMCASVVEVSGDCSSDRALECEAVWTECTQMCFGDVHLFNREERIVVPARLCVLDWHCSPVNWQAEKLSQKNCRFLRTATVLCTHTPCKRCGERLEVENG